MEHLGTSDTAIIKMRCFLVDGARASESGVKPVAATDGTLYCVRSHSVIIGEDVDSDDRPDILEGIRVAASGAQAAE